jgi:8-oxo-dGTP diphosphatase
MIEYVLGFCMEEKTGEVLLMERRKKDWQENKVNGVGGRIEVGESPDQAMIREFTEETGVDSSNFSWRRFCHLSDERGWIVHCFVGVGDISNASDITNEGILLKVSPNNIPNNVVDNLKWLIPMAFAKSAVDAHVVEI